MTRDIVNDFLDRIEKELYGLNAKDKAAILVELDRHIMDKASDKAKMKSLQEPTDEILEDTIREMGKPEDIAKEYMKVSMKEHELKSIESPNLIKAKQKMLYLGSAITVFIGFFLTAARHDAMTPGGQVSSQPFFPIGFALIILGVLTIGYARWIFPLKGREEFNKGTETMYYIGGFITVLLGIVFTIWLDSVIEW